MNTLIYFGSVPGNDDYDSINIRENEDGLHLSQDYNVVTVTPSMAVILIQILKAYTERQKR